MEKPFSPSCERNRQPIEDILRQVLEADDRLLLEVGSGTGQHASYFASEFNQLTWQPSDLRENHAAIQSWTSELQNVPSPVSFEIGVDPFPQGNYDVVFSANALHIMGWDLGVELFNLLGAHLNDNAKVLFYGPFNYDGKFTSQSNAQFELWLKDRDPKSGIRDFEVVEEHMEKNGFKLKQDFPMPANNRLLYFQK